MFNTIRKVLHAARERRRRFWVLVVRVSIELSCRGSRFRKVLLTNREGP